MTTQPENDDDPETNKSAELYQNICFGVMAVGFVIAAVPCFGDPTQILFPMAPGNPKTWMIFSPVRMGMFIVGLLVMGAGGALSGMDEPKEGDKS